MGQIIRCPLIGVPCMIPIKIEEKSFFLAETEKPEDHRRLRGIAVREALRDQYQLKSALDEKGINAFTCKICQMIQGCAYGIADITRNNPNVLFELGIMIALGKPTMILKRRNQRLKLKLPSDLYAIEVIPFTEYVEIIPQIRKILSTLPPPPSTLNPIDYIEKLSPECADELRRQLPKTVKEFKETIEEAKLDTILVPREEKKEIPPELNEKIAKLEDTLKELTALGFPTDAKTAFLRGNYFYNLGNFKKALSNYSWSLKLDPTHRSTYYNRGATYFRLGRYKEALVDSNRTLELKPDDHDTLNNRGNAYVGLGRYKEALADYNRALEIKPEHPRTLYNLACLFSLWGKIDDALTYLEKAIDKDAKYREDAKTDPDFNNIREDPRFKKLVGID